MASLQELQRNWEGLARTDPLWSICTDPQKRNRKWNAGEFFETGDKEIGKVLSYLRSLGLSPDPNLPVLDFGCGVGRLTRALSGYFPECWGVDISPTMVQLAQDFHKTNPRCHFCLNLTDNLSIFSSGYFGFVYTSIVLQHIERRFVEKYLEELIRALKPGGIFVFQAPDRFKSGVVERLRQKLSLRSRFERLLKKNQNTFQMEMHCIPENAVRKFLARQKVQVADVKLTNSADSSFNGDLQYLDQEPEHGYVSKQYCVVKTA
jgi:ubiquinone/menaquinone biosynthesis C-methylase UbiE